MKSVVAAALVLAALLALPLLAGIAGDDAQIEELVDHVRNGTPAQFEAALDALAAMGADAAPAVPGLIDNLDPPGDTRRERLSRTLVAIGEPAVPALVEGLMSWSGHTVVWCTRTLGRLGAQGAPGVPLLVGSLDGAHPERQGEILRALAGIGEAASDALPAVRALLASASEDVRGEAVRTLGRLGPEAGDVLVDLASGDDEVLARIARGLLGRTRVKEAAGPTAETLERLALRLRKGSESIRIGAARTIQGLGAGAAPLVPGLVEALRDESVHVRRAVVGALASIGPDASAAVDPLLAVLEEDEALRGDVLAALPALGPEARRAIPSMTVWLDDGSTRFQAACSLMRMGEAALPAIAEASRHPSYLVRHAILDAVRAVDVPPPALRPVFVAALDDEASSVRYAACEGLAALGPNAAPAVEALRGRLADETEGVRVAAARAMYAAGERGAELAPAFVEGLTSRTIVLFEDMDERLVTLGPAAVPALAEAMAHMDGVRVGAVCARIGKPATPALIEGLGNPKPSSRRAALEGLRAVEADDPALLAAVVARLKDEDRTVRAAAARALVPFATTCPEAVVERALPRLLAFYDRPEWWSDEEQAVEETVVALGELALPALRARIEEVSDPSIERLIQRIEQTE